MICQLSLKAEKQILEANFILTKSQKERYSKLWQRSEFTHIYIYLKVIIDAVNCRWCHNFFVTVCPLLRLQQQLAQLQKEKSEILKNLALYYFTFVDVMEFKVRKHTHIYTNLCCEGLHGVNSYPLSTGPCVWAAEHHRRLPGLLWHCKWMKCSTQTLIEVTLLRWMSRKCLFPLLSDGELWPHQELPGPGGDIHYTDDDTVSHRGEESHHRTLQLRPRDDTWSQVTERHKQTDAIEKFSEPSMCVMVSIVTMVLRVCVLVTGSTPGWARWSWITRTPWRRWWRSLFRMERCENCFTIQWCIDFCALSRCHWLFKLSPF